MAEVITRLKVESSEYDSKIKRAAEGIQHLAKVAHDGGGAFLNLEKAEIDFIKGLGDMNTSARTSTGQVKELTKAFVDLSAMYNQLSEEEKADEGGKALSASLERLKQRILEAKDAMKQATGQLEDTKTETNNADGSIGKLTSALGINIKQLTGWGFALAAGAEALKISKDAFMSAETNVDDWGRTVEGAKAVYESFLISLNNGDFSNFFSNLDQVASKAQSAYNALDNLNTVMTIINPERAKLQTEQQRLKGIIRREGANSQAGKDASRQLKAMEPALTAAYEKESEMNFDAFKAAVDARLAEAGLNLNQKSYDLLMKSFSDTATYELLKKNATGNVREIWESASGWGSYRKTEDTRNTNQKILDLFTDEWRQKWYPYLSASYTAQGSAYGMLLSNARYVKSTPPRPTKTAAAPAITATPAVYPEGSLPALTAELQYLQKMQSGSLNADEYGAWGYAINEVTVAIQKLKGEYKELVAPEGFAAGSINYQTQKVQELAAAWRAAADDDSRQRIAAELETQQGILDAMQGKGKGKETDNKKGNETVVGLLQKTTGGIGNIASGIEGLGIEVPEGIKSVTTGIQSVITILVGIQAILGIIETLNTIQTARGMIPFFSNGGVVKAASGYVVPGNYGFDAVPSLLTSGEVVLNRAQTSNLASQLTESTRGSVTATPYVLGEQIFLGLSNYLRRSGRGEIVMTK